MRVVFVSVPAAGHLDPMVPLARALADAGHQVIVAAGPDMVERASKLKLPALQTGPSQQQAGAEMRRRYPGGIKRGEDQAQAVAPYFVDIVATPMATDLMAALADNPPDLIIHDPNAYAAPLVAKLLGIPSVCQHYSSPGSPVEESRGRAVEPLWAAWGQAPRPLGGIFDYLVLGMCPPSLSDPDRAKYPTARRIRPMWTDSAAGPDWLATLNDNPTVYVSFGTLFGTAELFQTIIDALAHQSLNVIVTVGAGTDPDPLDPRSANVHIERFIPQSAILPHCDLVICHAGAGTMLGAVAHGLPMLCVPLGADHFFNAAMCQSAGVARILQADNVSGETVRNEALTLLQDGAYRDRAAAIRTEVMEMPSPAEWVIPLERLAEHRPATRNDSDL